MTSGPNIVSILQARMGSTRRPGKVLAPILDEPMLTHIVRRCTAARRPDAFVVATTDGPIDDPVADLAESLGVGVFRGSEEDVLDRYQQCASAFDAAIVVRLTGDDPFVDGPFIDAAVDAFLDAPSPCDYLDTTASATFPAGMAVQIFTERALREASVEATEPHCREHVVPFMHEQPGRYRCVHLAFDRDCSHHRWTVDTDDDLEFARRVFEHFGHGRFGWLEALAAVEARPHWWALNQGENTCRVLPAAR